MKSFFQINCHFFSVVRLVSEQGKYDAQLVNNNSNLPHITTRKMESIVDEPKIHFYEFMSIEVVDEYILTGIEYMVKSLLNSTQKLISLRYYSHEIATFLAGIKDLYFLIKRKGTYAENFYGLERINQRSKAQIAIEMVVWVVVPYLARKVQAKFNELKEKAEAGARLGTIANLFTKIFPIIYCLIKIATTVLKFRYLIDKNSKYYNIEYFVTKTELGYIQSEEPSPFPIMSLLKSPGLFIALVAHKIASYAFSNDKKKKGKDQIVEISAPIADEDKKQKECPICGKKFRNPAVLRSSGYVFCYGCIVPEIRSNRKCPVTAIASDQSQIQIIYQ